MIELSLHYAVANKDFYNHPKFVTRFCNRYFMKSIYILFYFGLVAIAVSCNKHNGGDKVVPVLTIISPAANQVYAHNASVAITGSITDDGLHELRINITNTATSALLYTKTISVHDLTSYSINESWVNNVAAITNATIKVEVEDHDGYNIEKKIQIILNP